MVAYCIKGVTRMLSKARIAISILISLPLISCGGNDKKTEVITPVVEPQAVVVRNLISEQVGGLDNLKVPETNADLPQPLLDDGTPDPTFETTEAKRYLGKQLFHDPVRTVRLDAAKGGVIEAAGTGSCGSCHFGEAGSKAGMQFNFNVGGEGRGYTDAEGNFIPRRRPQLDILPRLRQEPLFVGDLMVDHLPTLTDVYEDDIGIPSIAIKDPNPGELLQSGRFDALDSVSRNAPSVVGAAFNNRLLLGGFAGEDHNSVRGLNPFNHPAQENIALLLLDAHRMLEAQSAELQRIPVYKKLFTDAFPEEAARAEQEDDLNLLINDKTILRATATFMRTVVTRNSPWDKFLAGDNNALTDSQLRGAKLFFTDPADGNGGAGCFSCHSGPMLNKQHNDPDVVGTGQFIEENFINLGLSDHPLQALNRHVRNDPEFRDDGRKEITLRDEDAFEFRTVTLRQIRDSGAFFHNGEFTSVKDVVEYFNNGVPQDSIAGNASTLSTRFTHPRGEGSEPGLGLSEDEINDLTAFINDGLFDPAFVTFDPDSTTDTFQLNERDLTYSLHRPDLETLGAVDGRVASGLPQDNNDLLSRRDLGIDPPLDVTDRLTVSLSKQSIVNDTEQQDTHIIHNTSDSMIDTHLIIVLKDLPDDVVVLQHNGMTENDEPYFRLFLQNGVITPGDGISHTIKLRHQDDSEITTPISYNLLMLSGQGNP